MAVGDSNSFLARLKDLIPPGWFGLIAPVRDALLGGISDDFSNTFNLMQAARAAERINTTTGWLLDLAVADFFGSNFPRRSGETDDSYRTRFIAEIFRERVTKAGIAKAVFQLTGRQPKIFEMFSPGDCGGGYGIGRMGYGVAGAYGSLQYPNQIFVTAYRPKTGGIGKIAGYGIGPAGYGAKRSRAAYASRSQIANPVSDADIYAAVAATAAAGIDAWVDIQS